MRKLLWFPAFFAILFLGDRLAGHFLQRLADNSQFRYSRLYRGEAGADVLLVGNSRGLTFYQPYIEEITGLSTFNLSYNGLPMNVSEALAADFLDRYPAPRGIVIDITACDRINNELATAFLSYAAHSPRLDAMLQDSVPKMWWGGQVLRLTRFNNEVFQRALYYRNRSDEDWMLDRAISEKLAGEAGQHKYELKPESFRPMVGHMASLVKYAQNKGVPVKLVISPYFPGFRVDGLDALKTEAERATGLPVQDYRNALTDPALFGDFMHPNRLGSMRYIDMLKRDSILPR